LREFDYQFGNQHPNFLQTPFSQAANTSKSQFKFLIVYLHSHLHADTSRFCRNILCTTLVSDFFNEHFICWAGSVNASEGFRLSNVLGATSFPFLAVLSNNNIGGMTILDRIEGVIEPEDLISRLTTVLENHGAALTAARIESEERERDRRLREEQDQEYIRSLQEDQEKERLMEEERRKAQQQEELQSKEEQLKKIRQQEWEKKAQHLLHTLPPEPDEQDKSATRLVIRLTDGRRLQRRFLPQHTLQNVFDFVNSNRGEGPKYDLITNFPRKVFDESLHQSTTLEQAGLVPQAALFVEEK